MRYQDTDLGHLRFTSAAIACDDSDGYQLLTIPVHADVFSGATVTVLNLNQGL